MADCTCTKSATQASVYSLGCGVHGCIQSSSHRVVSGRKPFYVCILEYSCSRRNPRSETFASTSPSNTSVVGSVPVRRKLWERGERGLELLVTQTPTGLAMLLAACIHEFMQTKTCLKTNMCADFMFGNSVKCPLMKPASHM